MRKGQNIAGTTTRWVSMWTRNWLFICCIFLTKSCLKTVLHFKPPMVKSHILVKEPYIGSYYFMFLSRSGDVGNAQNIFILNFFN